MPTVLIVTGCCGVGKSTVSKLWATRRDGAVIRGDEIRLWIRNRSLRRAYDYQEPLVVETTIAAARNLLRQRLDIALDNVWFPGAIGQLTNALSADGTIFAVRLLCDLDENYRRDQQRPPGSTMGGRVKTLSEEMDAVEWSTIRSVDTSMMSAEQTVEAIDCMISVLNPRHLR